MAVERIVIIGGGLAGSEAAWQAAGRGLQVDLCEMRPQVSTPAHTSAHLAELVCSNSLKTNRENTAPWLLKEELRKAGSLLLDIASRCAVPAGQALAVDREQFAAGVTQAIEGQSLIRLRREEMKEIPSESVAIVATGPLTSDALADSIQRFTGSERLFFYDSISPVVDADTINHDKVFAGSRYGDGIDPAAGDYLNCPLTREEYQSFYDALLAAESVERHDFEDLNYFEACLPIEELARRGRDTLRFGPMKPVGLRDPRTQRLPHAVVQLRRENLRSDSYNLVGFQNHLKFADQKRILRMIPGLDSAEFLRYGQMHRNTYLNAPLLLTPSLQLRSHPRIFFAGQICGVEGYVESIATGLMAGIHAARLASTGEEPIVPPPTTACGSLCHYVSHATSHNYQPANMTYDLLPPLDKSLLQDRDKKKRHALQCQIALTDFQEWVAAQQLGQTANEPSAPRSASVRL